MPLKASSYTWDKTKRKTWPPRARLPSDVDRGFKVTKHGIRHRKAKQAAQQDGRRTKRIAIGAPEDFETVTRKRPSDVTMQIIEELLERMATGETVSRITSDLHMPPWLYIWLWLRDPKHAKFKEVFDQAEEAQFHRMAGETLDISDDSTKDYIEIKNSNGKVMRRIPNQELVNRSRLRVETRRWLLAKRLPKIYGESSMMKLANETGDGPATFLFGAITATKKLGHDDADPDSE